MKRIKKINQERALRKKRARSKISGTKDRPRLAVFRSNKNIYAQLIDDDKGHTLVSAFTKDGDGKDNKVNKAEKLGQALAEKAKKLNINKAVFDKGSYKYHGRVKALAESARKTGLKI